MNEITINNHAISIKEYNGQRVVTFKDIDAVHGRPEGTAHRNFKANKEHFLEGVDYFRLKMDEIRPFGITSHNGGSLITETGYLMLVKSFTDDLAWEVQRELVNCYFNQKHFEAVYKPTRPLTTDDYKDAASVIGKCHNSRLPIVLDLYRKAGFDINKIEMQNEVMPDKTDVMELVELLNKYSLTELCRMLDICKSSLYYYRIGKYKPNKERMKKIIKTLRR